MRKRRATINKVGLRVMASDNRITELSREAAPQGGRLAALDGLRALAALQVAAFHATRMLWSPMDASPAQFRLYEVVSFFTDYGFQAVMLFFVLSGFVIHLPAARGGVETFEARRFLWKRARRLYPALIAALALTYALDRIGAWLAPAVYAPLPPTGYSLSHSPGTLLGNLAFLQYLGLPLFGTDVPLWSLAYDGWYYMIYALVFMPVRRRWAAIPAYGLMLYVSLVGTVLHEYFFALNGFGPPFPVWHFVAGSGMWFLGAGLAEAYARGERQPRPRPQPPPRPSPLQGGGKKIGERVVLIAALAAILGLMITHDTALNLLRDWLWAGAAAGLIRVGASQSGGRIVEGFRRLVRLFAPLAGASYTLYLIHFPPMMLIRVLYLKDGLDAPTLPWLAAGVLLVEIGAAVGLARIVERPFVAR